MSHQFKREERYIVIKLKDLSDIPDHLRHEIVNAIKAAEFPQRECVVVESDWPEYEPTWAAIERRVSGQPALVDTRDKFESFLLAGRSRENPMVASLLDRGADGEYFNANTRAAFAWFVKGVESLVVVLPSASERDQDAGWCNAIERCQEAVREAGVTTAEWVEVIL